MTARPGQKDEGGVEVNIVTESRKRKSDFGLSASKLCETEELRRLEFQTDGV